MKRRTERHRISPSYLFLMELVVALLLFSVASAACVSIFMQSHKMSEQAEALGLSIDRSSSMAELLRGCASIRDVIEVVQREYPGSELSMKGSPLDEAMLEAFEPYEMNAQIYFDEEGLPCDPSLAQAVMTVEAEQTNGLMEASIRCYAADEAGAPTGEAICSLPVTHYARRSAHE